MHINRINTNNISFQRAIKIETNANYHRGVENHRVTPFVWGVLQTMKSNYNYFDDKKEASEVGRFLKSKIADYDKKDFSIRNIEYEAYLFTGQEARKAQTIDKETRIKFKELDKRYMDENMDDKLYKIYRKNIYMEKDRRLLEMVENGEDDKPDTKLFLKQNESTGKLDSITYKSVIFENNKYKTIECDNLVINNK